MSLSWVHIDFSVVQEKQLVYLGPYKLYFGTGKTELCYTL